MVQDGVEGVAGMSGLALLEEAAAAKAEAISIKARTGAPKLQLPHHPACSRPHKVPLFVHCHILSPIVTHTVQRSSQQIIRMSCALLVLLLLMAHLMTVPSLQFCLC